MAEKTMRNKTMTFLSLIGLSVAMTVAPAVRADDEEDGLRRGKVRPSFLRESEQRPDAGAAPEAGELPRELVLVEVAPTSPVAAQTRPPQKESGPRDSGAERARYLKDEAVAAAAWTADRVAGTAGWQQYYRVGFHRGMRIALQDDSLGGRDYMAGVRVGRRDPEAQRLGVDIGRRAADEAAAEAAPRQVADQFRDLYREPRRAPVPTAPGYVLHEQWAARPQLDEVFVAYPVARIPHVSRRASEAFNGWDWDARRLYDCPRYGEFFDISWQSASDAFSVWKDRDNRSRVYRRLRDPAERTYFRDVFTAEFARLLPSYYDRHLRRGYHEGFDDGWTYGALVNHEWHYRQGYTEGFDEAVASSAAAGFQGAYAYAYERSYNAAFTEWSENPMPGIVSVRLADGNDDGIFQPGEELLVDYEIANYGGRAGDFTVRFDGREIEHLEEATVRLPARELVRSIEPIRARISPHTAARTLTEVDLTLADLRESVELMVRYPLEFPRETDLDRDSLAGRAVVRVLVANRSRRPIDAVVALERVDGYTLVENRDLGILPPGSERWVPFEVDGIRPLDLISGDLSTHFTVRGAGVVQDRMEFRFPDAASDLRNRELLELMIALSRESSVPWADVSEARALLLRRLQADWIASVRGNGNPYKQDFKENGSRTALGDLVQTYLDARPAIRNPDVFTGLDDEIEAFAEELPGAHPFLRKYMKRLARKLG